MARDHRKLHAFTLADELAVSTYRTTIGFPLEERYGLQSQLRRAAVSVPANIVEVCSRVGESDFLRFLDIAFASTRELLYLIDLSQRLGYLDTNSGEPVAELGRRTAAALAALMKSIRPSPKTLRP